MRIDGGCFCGAIAYEATVDPGQTSICHCTDCQRLTGTAFRVTVPAREENYRITKGTPKVYVKTAESGARRAQAFCATCGTPIYAADPDGGNLSLRIGMIAERHELGEPARQIWCDSALDWAFDLDGVAKSAKQ